MPARMTGQEDYQQALDSAQRLLGQPLVLPLGDGEPPVGEDFRRLATIHTFGDSWPRGGLDDRSRALISSLSPPRSAPMSRSAGSCG
jgi:4-carboxymuconolactone decarboxylase